MSRLSTKQSQILPTIPEFYYEQKILDSQETNNAIYEVIDKIINDCSEIIYKKYIQTQLIPYASRTIAEELLVNASWTMIPIYDENINAEPDEDLELPPIDEWAGGVLPIREQSDLTCLRCSVTPQRDTRKTPRTIHSTRTQSGQPFPEKLTSKDINKTPLTFTSRSFQKKDSSHTKTETKPHLTEAQIITKAFEEAKKKTKSPMKSITVDSNFSVIQINEPKTLPPTIIVPKVSITKPVKPTQAIHANRHSTQQREKPMKRRKSQTKLLEQDNPVFDEEITDIPFDHKFVCSPGVTLKDGNFVKSKAPQANNLQLTRAQFEQYLDEMKKNDN
ncbi:hypothetical protein GPJ56_010565 [Histomonas meleagridis]|uniref:uncharacterized protein n=1 Tax=Histomonas meleagridis TaxID=135588 RepID=UPI003559AADC|nr:hypothetical protein GPJ56_010565 [Histomonas meleagridis]KAH0797977.1 hypothetical protein GO595_009196 [Histomonas meleagridis]